MLQEREHNFMRGYPSAFCTGNMQCTEKNTAAKGWEWSKGLGLGVENLQNLRARLRG